ncbi:Crp/Fnr family transcriptional regulator [Vagococcus vulneris]|uniref:Cyclic nucleotide-binding domain-containing protein n=1 Tax=Vagococcus vulneris TaxID=1977869 RepID=A0A430A0E9_9ENTE|nr:Crp/Fnr family transcriptional regulator [Vagococcus vulneris]RST99794.1 hypothetical protein CBF37_03455 [Vagococcus vulneris]
MDKSGFSSKQLDILASYSLTELPKEACRLNYYQKGSVIYFEGETIRSLGIIVSGKAKICLHSPDGKRLTLCYYESKSLIGDVELLTEQTVTSATVIAMTDIEMIEVPFNRLEKELLVNTAFVRILGSRVAKNLIRSSENAELQSLYTGQQRLCSYILRERSGLSFDHSLIDTAYSIGLSYRQTLRLMKKLCHLQVLTKTKVGYNIENNLKLEKLSGMN